MDWNKTLLNSAYPTILVYIRRICSLYKLVSGNYKNGKNELIIDEVNIKTMILKELIKNQTIIIDDHKRGCGEIKSIDNPATDVHKLEADKKE